MKAALICAIAILILVIAARESLFAARRIKSGENKWHIAADLVIPIFIVLMLIVVAESIYQEPI